MADTAAVHIAKNQFPSFVADISEHHNQLLEQRSMLQKLYSLQLQSKCRAQLSTTLDAENQRQTKTFAAPRFVPFLKRNVLLDGCNSLGVTCYFRQQYLTLSRALLEWLHEIQWPIEASEPDTVGITWLEMVASFCNAWTGILFRVKRTGPDNNLYVQAIADHDENSSP